MAYEHGDSVHREIGADESVSNVVVEAVSEARGVEMTELSPLTRTVDCDALDALYETLGADGSVSFVYEGLDVVVSGSGVVTVREPRRD